MHFIRQLKFRDNWFIYGLVPAFLFDDCIENKEGLSYPSWTTSNFFSTNKYWEVKVTEVRGILRVGSNANDSIGCPAENDILLITM